MQRSTPDNSSEYVLLRFPLITSKIPVGRLGDYNLFQFGKMAIVEVQLDRRGPKRGGKFAILKI